MFKNVLKYELKRSLIPFSTLYGIAIAFSLAARIKFFSLTDMPLFYLIFFGTTVILLFRFWATMFGQEATFLFSVPLKAKTQVSTRLLSALIFSVISTLAIATAILIQGEAMATLLAELSLFSAVILFIEIAVSMFYLVLQLETALTLSNLPFSRINRKLWIVSWTIILFGATSVLSAITANFIDQYIIISQAGGISIGKSVTTPLSFSFSLNTTLWMLAISPLCIWLINHITENYLSIT